MKNFTFNTMSPLLAGASFIPTSLDGWRRIHVTAGNSFMGWVRNIVGWLAAVVVAMGGMAAEAHGHGGGEHHGLSAAASQFHVPGIPGFVVTNSTIVTILVALGIIVFAQLATRKLAPVPSGLQNFAEWLVESLYGFICSLLGPDLGKRAFWFFGTLFLFILFTNWFGLIPGVGTITYGGEPILRGGNADLNTTSALAMMFSVLWLYWSVRSLGVGGFLKHIFAAGGGGKGFMGVFMVLVFFMVGLIEVASILSRPVSLSFRLYGNVFAGENILESMMTVVPWLGWLIPLPFYFLELLVGIVQALVFTLLTAVFTALMCGSHGHDEHGHGDHH
ncbi:MAG: FoF1 ATP synthase subunit a [Verrucomicrobiota bacterium]